ncbi:hypothetical protein E4634_03480 [Mangrovimicrobium sediminis]|uniref:Uncharacterized protein n=1 Tax=Mangrovimicrobium sediminis TaxID=2562682 RepID=A0A4Z0M6F9_9GAMM|nr:hypothetical protein [Haliea sp. SAOS-164]TGD75084.1 hypothetical protein E4634_03480 [Haliea sp. SAOS-164]
MLWLQSFFDNTPAPGEPVNPWSLRKSPRIKSLLIRVAAQLDDAHWRVDASARTNPDGIYLTHPADTALRAYLHVHGQQAGRAGLHLEFPPVDGQGPTYETYEDLTPARLGDMLAAHFCTAGV